MRKVIVVLGVFLSVFAGSICYAGLQERFEGEEKLRYKVSFNGLPSGTIEWQYLGKRDFLGKQVDVLKVSSNTKLFKILNMVSSEEVLLDSQTHLPLKVKRDLVVFGKKELIEEVYNQDQGFVTITKTSSKTKITKLYQDKPIHNILELLYFFPQDLTLKRGEWMGFNLPTQKIKMKFIKERILTVNTKKLDTYFLVGRGAKKFNLWLDKEKRLPLRLEFILPVGKIIIKRVGGGNDS